MYYSVEEKALIVVGVVSAFFILVFVVHALTVFLISRGKVQRVVEQNGGSVEMKEKGNDDTGILGGVDPNMEFKSRKQYRVLMILSTIALVFFELTILVLVMFDKLHIAAGIIIMVLVAWLHWISIMTPSSSTVVAETISQNIASKWLSRVIWKLKNRKIYYIPAFAGILLIVLALNIVLEGTCENNLAIVNTRIMRKYMSPTCVRGPPCFVYLTLNENPHSSIIVNYHTPVMPPTPATCHYDTVSRNGTLVPYVFNSTGSSYTMPNLEVERHIHWVHLTNLTPNTTYYFSCGSDAEGWSVERAFKTQSNNPNDPVTFIVGGDVDITAGASQMSQVGAQQNPSFAMVGGDLAYDRAQYTCYRIVDKWLDNWQRIMVTPSGLSIPLVASIGNHEVIGDFEASKDRIPFFLRYFPQFTKENDPGVNHVDDRLSYNAVTIGGPNGTIIFNLDSDHSATTSMSAQAAWMRSRLDTDFVNSRRRFAIYHVPMYPSVRAYSNTNSANVRSAFMSVFDQYKFQVGFENHDHVYKRTKSINNGQVVNNSTTSSTVYMGDGAWGKIRSQTPSLQWYQDTVQSVNYILRIDITPTDITYRAFNIDAQVFDQGKILTS